ncbi:MAG TPA: aldo/keto reductase [Cyclobacteriaceae bacterium]|jgi:predicted oxidoreductase|nr:aldo/keto reductase [Cyclobacteriaceae bacterium]
MERRKIHNEGPAFSRIIAGAWRWHTVPQNAISNLINTALDQGITTFDHADIYGDHSNEEIFGNVIRNNASLRDKMELVTKCGIKFSSAKRPATWVKHYDTSKEHILWSAENSLKMLGTDRIDLLLIHRPDPLLDPQVVAEAFTTLKSSGKVLHFGVSNFTSAQFEMLQSYLPFPLVTNQIEISLTCTHTLFDGTLDGLMKHRVSPMAWSPLGGGSLVSGSSSDLFKKKSTYNATDSQMSLAWLLRHPSVIFPVIGTTNADRIVESARASSIKIDTQDWFEMLKIAMGKEMP